MIRNVLWLTVAMALAVGCGHTAHQIDTLRTGADYFEKRAEEIEQASKSDNRPPSEE